MTEPEAPPPEGPVTEEITGLLSAWRSGDRGALDRLVALLYDELRRIASRQMAGSAGSTLQPTAVVHEAYLRLAGAGAGQYGGRAHFLAAAARAMRHVLIDHARARGADKRWGALTRVTLGSADSGVPATEVEILDIDRALDRLVRLDPQKAEIVELRFFGGLSVDETAEVLGVSTATVKRHWSFAKAWLAREVDAGGR
jgi:RNA polymerase sigma factor (TIGR02999 family)